MLGIVGIVVGLVVVTIDIAKSHELDAPLVTVLAPLPPAATVTASLRECPVTGHTCRLVAAVDQPGGDAVLAVSQALSSRGWPLVAGAGESRQGCRTTDRCAKVWPFAYYEDTFGLPAGLHVSLDQRDELRGNGAVVVVTDTA